MSVELRQIRPIVSETSPGVNGTNQTNAAPNNKKGFVNPAYREDHGSMDDVVVAVEDPSQPLPPPVYVSEPLDDDEDPSNFARVVGTVTTTITALYAKHHVIFWRIIYAILILLYAVYFSYAMYYRFGDEGSIRLLWVTCLVVFCVIIYISYRLFGEKISKALTPCLEQLSKHEEVLSWVAVGIIWVAVIIYIIVDLTTITKTPYNLVSASGIIIYILLLFICSYSPARVRWRPVVWGLALQFIFALLILRWEFGYRAFEWLGNRTSEFLSHSDAGASFLFGADTYEHHFFAFKVLPVIVFFSMAISIFYYLGWMQVLIRGVAWVMQVTMGTTAAESLNAAGNIFIGQSEAPLLIRPLIQNMTRSELHAVMTGGFATIAGSVLAAYILFKVPANHLISASVMSAPAALAMSKLFYPETEKSKTTAKDVQTMEKSPARNIIEAASSGASASISLVANIAVNLIAFLSLLQFMDATLTWFGNRVDLLPPNTDLTFEFITSYVLWPFAFIMGVDYVDCRQVGRLIGIKTFLNEFVAYQSLGSLVENKAKFDSHVALNGTWFYVGNDIKLQGTNTTLISGILHSERSLIISTYALCGFANFGSIGVMIGALSAMAPHRRADLSSIALRAMIAGNVACFMTACIAGLFYQESLDA